MDNEDLLNKLKLKDEEIKQKVKAYKETKNYNPMPEQTKKWARIAYLKKKN
jgi:hypothetical protein